MCLKINEQNSQFQQIKKNIQNYGKNSIWPRLGPAYLQLFCEKSQPLMELP